MKQQIEELEKEYQEQVLIIHHANERVKDINLKLRKLKTLQKKVDKVLGNMTGDEIKVTS